MSINQVGNYKSFDNAFGVSNEGGSAENSLSAYGDEYISGSGNGSDVKQRKPLILISQVAPVIKIGKQIIDASKKEIDKQQKEVDKARKQIEETDKNIEKQKELLDELGSKQS